MQRFLKKFKKLRDYIVYNYYNIIYFSILYQISNKSCFQVNDYLQKKKKNLLIFLKNGLLASGGNESNKKVIASIILIIDTNLVK